MSSKDYQEKKNKKFLKYWETKRASKTKYTLKTSAIFSFILSTIYCFIKDGFTINFLKSFPLFFLITTIIYALYVYFIEYNLHEKRYQKLNNKTFDD